MDSKTKNLGSLKGNIIVFGGVYSNLQALEALIQVTKVKGIPASNCISTGDIIGYCAQPEKTIETFKNWGAHSICGNVELQLRNDKDSCGCDFKSGSKCDMYSQNWYPYAKSNLSQTSINYLNTLPEFISFTSGNKKATVVHGSLFNTSEYIFKSTPWATKQQNFNACQSNLIIAGHSGLPFTDSKGLNTWVNPGVIGMPANNGKPEVWYAVLNFEDDNPKISFNTLSYNYTLAQQHMEANKLPKGYINTLSSGIWDNTEILPADETLQQGKPLLI